MDHTTTLSIRLSAETKAQLGLLATATRRSKSFLAAEAVAAYVARERQIIAGIERGLVDMAAGNIVPHDAAMGELDALIDSIEHSRKA
jgi:predicted transcriptional regulator